MSAINNALLAFEDGTLFHGKAFGATQTTTGEVVFNTSMTGYQEIITDPSYYGQIVTMTAPQIGNYGINPTDAESQKPHLFGFIVRELSPTTSNWQSTQDLHSYLKDHNIPGIEGIDTRAITKKVRSAGVMKACLSTENISPEAAIQKAKDWAGLEGIDCLKKVSCQTPYTLDLPKEQTQQFTVEGTTLYKSKLGQHKPHIVAFDFGAKHSIFKQLAARGFKVTIVPADTSAQAARELNPDGIFLSNGPGDPAAATYAHQTVQNLMPDFPIFGICMGHQIITHALGGSTFKLKFGHRGGNQPVKNLESNTINITAQNHGYAASPQDLEKAGAIITEINLNDNTVAGLKHKEFPTFSVQYHPEAAPGPNDASHLFDKFYQATLAHSQHLTPSP